ncbi:MAG: SusC/RagA family TonB-linked outer membrane protein, partial [Muribaculaceae bacterium]|nr:SusC/RagA family TonB-linked outer membrane protein [Muribaculaceae bacterium]
DNNMLRNSPYASMYTEDGGYQQYPMTGKQTNGGYNYFFDRQFYDLDKGYTNLNTIFTAKVNLPYGFTYSFNISPRYQWFHDYYFMDSALPNASANSRGVNREHYKAFEWNLNNTLTWDKEYGDVHHVQVTLVQEAEDHKTYKDRIEARNISPTDALGFHWTDGANKEQSGFSTYDSHYSGASYLGRAFYSYDNRYMITASFRRDGFSGFGRNNVWGNFGAVGLGWNFSDEKFMESTRDWLNNAKLRLSWGTNGNRDFGANGSTDPYLTMANLSMGGSMVYFNDGTSTVVKSLYMNRLAAPNLRWEKTEAYNIGLDFGVIDNRLTGAIDWYFKKTRDMIMNQRLPSFTGFSSIYANLGEVQNSGIEISLTSVNIEKQNFTWTTSAGFSYNRNRINHIYYDYDENGKENDDTSNGWYIGHPIGEIWYYESDGVWQNTPEDIAQAALVGQRPGDPKVKNNYTEDDRIVTNADGTTTRIPVYNDKDKTYLGTTNPPIYWNLKNDFVLWKDLTISFSLYSYMGHKSLASYWLNQDNGGSQVINACNLPAKEYWTPENATNDYCRIMAVGPNTGLAGGISKLYNRNFVRLDNISIGYTLPQAWTRKAMLEKVRLTVSCNNVCTISGWEYGDPETGGLARRTFNFGVNVTF